MDEDSYVVFPWMNGGEFSSLAELELAYGDNCVDGAIADTAELWAMRSGTSAPCVGNWSPSRFSLDDEIQEWASAQRRRPDDMGLYITGFREWVESKLSKSPEFDDFVWNRFVEFSVESMSNLKKNIKIACGDDILLDNKMMYKFRERIGVMPYYVRISLPPMPSDTEERLAKAVADALQPKHKKVRFRLSKSAFSTAKTADESPMSTALAQPKPAQKKQDKDRHVCSDALLGAISEEEPKKDSIASMSLDKGNNLG